MKYPTAAGPTVAAAAILKRMTLPGRTLVASMASQSAFAVAKKKNGEIAHGTENLAAVLMITATPVRMSIVKSPVLTNHFQTSK
jgi:hypothetical protein